MSPTLSTWYILNCQSLSGIKTWVSNYIHVNLPYAISLTAISVKVDMRRYIP